MVDVRSLRTLVYALPLTHRPVRILSSLMDHGAVTRYVLLIRLGYLDQNGRKS